jgi:DNA-binding winged helix-turn-helix (wHTH) protein
MDAPRESGDGLLTTADLAERDDFRLGKARVSPSTRTISGPGGATDVEPRVMQVLVVLADAAGHVVARRTLFERCWGEVYVGDDSLNRVIAALRKIVAEVAEDSVTIETITRTGYRLTAATPELDPAASADSASGEGQSQTISRRVLVGGAVAAALLAGGAGIRWMRRLQADPRFDALLDQGAAALRMETREGNEEADRLFEQAVAMRPEAAKAWGLLAYTKSNFSVFDVPADPQAAVRDAERAARKALVIDPRESNALTAMILLQGTMLDWATREDRLRRVLAIDSENTFTMRQLSAQLQAAGRTHESLALNERMIAIEPMSPAQQFGRAYLFWILGQLPRSDMAIERARQLWPDHPGIWNARLIIFAFTNRALAALAMLDDERKRPLVLTPTAISVLRASFIALDQRSPETISAARKAILDGAPQSPGLAVHGVMVLSALGDLDAAFEVANGFLLSRGSIMVRPQPNPKQPYINTRGWRQTQWLFTPPTAAMRIDPRFKPLCNGIGLTDYWRKRGIGPDPFQMRV